MTNANRFNQTELEISFLLYGDYDSLSVYAAEQNNKLFEEDITTPGKRNKGSVIPTQESGKRVSMQNSARRTPTQ